MQQELQKPEPLPVFKCPHCDEWDFAALEWKVHMHQQGMCTNWGSDRWRDDLYALALWDSVPPGKH